MANKPFAIQGADLTLGGVNLQAGTTGVVIPGVTQAVNFRVKEVDEMPNIGGQDLGDDAGAITVIDNAEYLYLVDDGDSPSADYVSATYSVDELNELGDIEEITVETPGVFLAADKSRAEASNMWATLDPTPFVSFNPDNWIQIPFRPKMRAGEVENVGGGTADTGNFTFNEDTITNSDGMKLTTNRGTLAMGTNMEVPGVAGHFHIAFDGSNSNPPASDLFLGDDHNYVKLPGSQLDPTAQYGVEIGTDNRGAGPQNIEVDTVDELVPPGGVWRFFIDHEDYPNLGSLVSVGDTVTTSWGTPITATITDVVEEPGNWWKIHVAQNIAAGFSGGDTVSFGASVLSHTWRFGTDGTLTLPNGMTVDSYGTSGTNATVTIGGDNTEIRIDNDGAPPGFLITTDKTGENYQWLFGPDGDITFPDGTTQTTAYTGQNSGAIGTFFVVVNDDGTVSKSTDGVSWTTGADQGDGIERVATDGVTVAMIQSDQLSWTTFAGLEASTYVSGSSGTADEIGGETVDWRQIDYAGGYFVAVGSYTPTGSSFTQGVYGYSTDGRSWTFETVDQTVVEFFGNDPVDSDWQFSDVDYNGVGWMFSVSDDEGPGDANGGGVYITDLTATVTSARCFSMNITYKAAWNGSAWYMEGDESIAGVNTNLDPRNGTFDGPIDPWATGIQDLGLSNAGGTVELAGGNGYIAASDSDGHVAWSDDNGQTWHIVTPIPYTRTISLITQASPAVVTSSGEDGESGEKVVISGSSVSGYNGTFYWKSADSSLYTDQALTTPFDTSGLAPFTGTATLTWSNGQYIDAMDYINGYFYIGNDNEQIARTTNFVTWTIVDDQTNDFEYWDDIAGFVGTGGDIGDIVVTVDDDEGVTKLTLANKDFTLETTRTGTQDADINLTAADDIFIEANGDDIVLSAADQVRINTGWNSNDDPEDHPTWTFNGVGQIEFPDGSVQTTAYPSADIWVQEFETSLGAADTPAMAASVEYLPDGDIVALMIHSENTGGGETGAYSSVARFTSAGVKVWSMAFKGADYTNPWGLAVSQDGHIYVAGSSSTNGGGYEIATLTRLDTEDGSINWSKAYDVGVSNYNTVVDVDSFGQPIVVGYVYDEGNALIVTSKINADTGAVTWSRALDGQGDENAYGMAVGPSGEVVTVGWMTQFGITDAAATLYTDPVSNVNWAPATSIDITGSSGASYTVSFTGGVPTFTNIVDPVGGRTVDQTLDTIGGASFGGETGVDDMVVKVGTLVANETDDRMLIVKYNSAGSIQWQKAVQVLVGFDCKGADADIDSEGNIYVCGNFEQDSGGTVGMIIIKFNSLGVKQWTRTLQGNCGNFATSIVVSPDNFLYLSAVTIGASINDVNMVIAKYDTTGDLEWQRLLTNTDGMTFAGDSFFSTEGGSNLAVRDGYVAVGGGFGDLGNFLEIPPNAIVTQFLSRGDVFLAGNYEFVEAEFSGDLNNTASNITVVDAGKGDSNFAGAFDLPDFDPDFDLTSDLIGTLYHGSGDETRLFNGGQSLVLETTGAVTLPKGGTISEGYVTSNPTIQLTPADPDVASQKLVIKGGSNYNFTNNGITINYQFNTANNDDTLEFYINGASNYNNQTLYWWIYPENANLTTPSSGTIAINGTGGSVGPISFVVDNDDYEFTVRVSPENNNYDPANTGVESGLINADAPTFDSPYHLHLTTGDLTETSIFLGTDDHNVRTTTDGNIEITTPSIATVGAINFGGAGYTDGTYTNQATTGGSGTGLTVDYLVNTNQVVTVTINQQGVGYNNGDVITIPGGSSNATVLLDVAANNVWEFGTDGTTTLPGALVKSTVAKTGIAYNTGTATALEDSTYIGSIVDGSYGPFTRGLVTFTVVVTSGVAAYTVTATTGNTAVGAVIGTLDTGDLGGTSGSTSNISVADVVQAATAIDLTKSINKLTDGVYTLANGVEGQIMYLVRQNGSTAANISVEVANARWDGSVYSDQLVIPFQIPFTDMVTIIFTDGAWQASTFGSLT